MLFGLVDDKKFVVPGHGDPLHGARAMEVLTETARALRRSCIARSFYRAAIDEAKAAAASARR